MSTTITTVQHGVPGPGLAETTATRAAEIDELYFAVADRSDAHELSRTVARAEQILADIEFQRELAKLLEPATQVDLAKNLAALVAGFPNFKGDATFAQALVSDVASLRPCVGAVQAGCRKVRRTCEFLSIAAVMRAVSDAQSNLALAGRFLAGLPARVDEARMYLNTRDEERARRASRESRLRLSAPRAS